MSTPYEQLSPRERENRSKDAIQHLTCELGELMDLRTRQVLARAILGHSDNPICRQALAALDGKPLTDIAGEGE